jgi:hypothetical protein
MEPLHKNCSNAESQLVGQTEEVFIDSIAELIFEQICGS